MLDIPKGKKLILFDGVCNLCNDSVLKIIRFDKENTYLFTSLQSEKGKEIIQYLNIDTNAIDSIILYEPGVSYEIKSTAALKIIIGFGGLWNLMAVFFVFSESIRNNVYDFIAKNRYKWFGKKEVCMVPTDAIKQKFI